MNQKQDFSDASNASIPGESIIRVYLSYNMEERNFYVTLFFKVSSNIFLIGGSLLVGSKLVSEIL